VFRLIRLIFLLLFAFIAGVLYERNIMADTCLDRGGHVKSGICIGAQ